MNNTLVIEAELMPLGIDAPSPSVRLCVYPSKEIQKLLKDELKKLAVDRLQKGGYKIDDYAGQ